MNRGAFVGAALGVLVWVCRESPAADRVPLEVTPVAPVEMENSGGVYRVDFGADAYGNLQISFPAVAAPVRVTVRLGEKLAADGSIDRKPPGSVNYREIPLAISPEKRVYTLTIPGKERHRAAEAVHEPAEIGEVTPFRYAEIEGSPVALGRDSVRQLFVHAPFKDDASDFACSDDTLNAVWKLCKHTMKATTAFGIYIDGERERIPYEADAYINQLSHYACDLDPRIARYTFEHLLAHPTWPTEWSLHMPMIAAEDYWATGDPVLAEKNWDALKKKLLMEKAGADGLLRAGGIVDWPEAERDGYNNGGKDPRQGQQVGPEVNTVVNAFYYHALVEMKQLAQAIHREDEARDFEAKARQVYAALNEKCFDAARGIYIDGVGSPHASLHANMFPLAFDLVPPDRRQKVADFVQSRGMACSVYGAQYLLEGLFKSGKDDYAIHLLTDKSDRSWWHMIELGSTMTLEAWDAKYKPNLTWNHAWGAAPANIISRYILGVRPLEPGYTKILIAPGLGPLAFVRGKVPTPKGPVLINAHRADRSLKLELEIPADTIASIELPGNFGESALLDGIGVNPAPGDHGFILDGIHPGRHAVEIVQRQ